MYAVLLASEKKTKNKDRKTKTYIKKNCFFLECSVNVVTV